MIIIMLFIANSDGNQSKKDTETIKDQLTTKDQLILIDEAGEIINLKSFYGKKFSTNGPFGIPMNSYMPVQPIQRPIDPEYKYRNIVVIPPQHHSSFVRYAVGVDKKGVIRVIAGLNLFPYESIVDACQMFDSLNHDLSLKYGQFRTNVGTHSKGMVKSNIRSKNHPLKAHIWITYTEANHSSLSESGLSGIDLELNGHDENSFYLRIMYHSSKIAEDEKIKKESNFDAL